jgi:hypothetical protein
VGRRERLRMAEERKGEAAGESGDDGSRKRKVTVAERRLWKGKKKIKKTI